ncbi:MAG: sulfatase [bacterium]|nr:sulfatase [bacterium]
MVVLTAALVLASGCTREVSEDQHNASEDSLNVVLIVLDALRADRLSLYGNPERTSPNIDQLAATGVVFEHAIAQAPWTPPSMATLFTGTYQSFHQVTHSAKEKGVYSVLGDRMVTLAELFQQRGYHTGAVSAQPWVAEATGFSQGFDDFVVFSGINDPFRTDKVMLDGLAWLNEKQTRAQKPTAPFFLYLHFINPHYPYAPPWPFDVGVGKAPERFAGGVSLEVLEDLGRPSPVAPAERDYLLSLYDSEIKYVDWWIGVLIRQLERRKILDKTLIVLTSDHGEAFYEHGRYGHVTTLYNEMLHIPLVLSHPKLFPKERRVAEPVGTVDLLPTIAALAGLEVPAACQGENLLAEPLRGHAYAEGNKLASFKLQTPDWSLIVEQSAGRVELYDSRADAGETTDLAPARPELVRDLTARAMAIRRSGEGPTSRGAQTELDEDVRKQLEALGYLD